MAGYERAARAYHLVHSGRGKDYADEARQIEAIVRQFVPQARSLLDVACGGGGHLAHLAASFETVAGVELSPHMIDEAHRVHPDLELHQGDMRTFRLARRFDAVVCLFSSVAYMTTPVDLVAEEHRLRMYEAGDYRDALAAAGLDVRDATGLTGRGRYVGLNGATRGG